MQDTLLRIAENFDQRAKDLMTNFHATHRKKGELDKAAMAAKFETWKKAASILRNIANGTHIETIEIKPRVVR